MRRKNDTSSWGTAVHEHSADPQAIKTQTCSSAWTAIVGGWVGKSVNWEHVAENGKFQNTSCD